MSVQVDTDTMLRLVSNLKVRGGTQDVTEVRSWNFKMAHRLRLELAEQAGRPQTASAGPPRPLPAGEGRGLPTRGKFRFRLEDAAFD